MSNEHDLLAPALDEQDGALHALDRYLDRYDGAVLEPRFADGVAGDDALAGAVGRGVSPSIVSSRMTSGPCSRPMETASSNWPSWSWASRSSGDSSHRRPVGARTAGFLPAPSLFGGDTGRGRSLDHVEGVTVKKRHPVLRSHPGAP
jgi:hypothetical protein